MADVPETRFELYADEPATAEIVEGLPTAIPNKNSHERLLQMLKGKLECDRVTREVRLHRFMEIDRFISTWQKLSEEDSQRKAKEEATGEPQATSIILPLNQSHLDDMVSFFAGVFSPTTGDFFATPDKSLQDATIELMAKLNGDAKIHRYYLALTQMIRSLLKYNMGGVWNEWVRRNDPFSNAIEDANFGQNKVAALDMYNFMWDPLVQNPSQIAKEAEWAAVIHNRSRMWLVKRQDSGAYVNLDSVIGKDSTGEYRNGGNRATFYKNPPSFAAISPNDAVTSRGKQGANWDAYGASLGSDRQIEISGHEVITMYCWLNPKDYKLVDPKGVGDEEKTYHLWRFEIVDMKAIVSAQPMINREMSGETEGMVRQTEIPFYAGYLNVDDMGFAQRSIAELLQPFQSYGSFLLNSHVKGTRANIYGIQVYDPSVVDFGTIPTGAVTARIPSKVPGRDLRTAIQDLRSTQDVKTPLDSLVALLGLVKEFFPSQALPSQIAGMDRAIQSQVQAVLQGVNRRLHMLVRIVDTEIMEGLRFNLYLNIATSKAVALSGVTDEQAMRSLGSGLEQLNREIAEQGMRQLLFTLIQNPQTASGIDILGLMNYWSSLLNVSVDLTSFLKQPEPQQPQAAPIQGAAPANPPEEQ